MKKNTKEFAHDLWIRRGCPDGDQECDWYCAEGLVKGLRRYFSEEAAQDPAGLKNALTELLRIAGYLIPKRGGVLAVAVLDGAPEHRDSEVDAIRRAFPSNGTTNAIRAIRKKTTPFYELCSDTFQLYNAAVLPEGESGEERAKRLFEDACIAVFEGVAAAPTQMAVRSALQLVRSTRALNDELQLPWNKQFHARVSIASTIENVISGLELTWRDEISVEPRSLLRLDQASRQILYATGIRPAVCHENAEPTEAVETQEAVHAA